MPPFSVTRMLPRVADIKERLPVHPDVIVFNGAVHTMDSSHPRCEAVAALGERVIAEGNNEEIRRIAGPQTKVIDAEGCMVLPGFNDAHVHFLMGGFSLGNVDLRSASTPARWLNAWLSMRSVCQRVNGSWAAVGTMSVGQGRLNRRGR